MLIVNDERIQEVMNKRPSTIHSNLSNKTEDAATLNGTHNIGELSTFLENRPSSD